MDCYRTTMEEKEITGNLKHRISMSHDETIIYFNVDYLDGKFTIEKTFRNNYFGTEELGTTIDDLSTEEKVRKYLRLGDE